jgi:NAD(P)-dependent dehydrogenase (short-subunit alcohol dehydrogenase family)
VDHRAASALVTGATSGIGRAIASMLAQEGFALTLVARGEDRLEAVARELRAEGAPGVTCAVADLTTEEGVVAAVAAHAAGHAGLDVLVTNAGIGFGGSIDAVTARRFDVQVQLNLRAAVLLYREAAALLRATAARRGRALVVSIASAAGVRGAADLAVYAATKAGLIGLSHSMTQELGPDGVRSCAISPGTVDTPLTAYLDGDRDRLLPPTDVAEVVRMLLRLSPTAVIGEIVIEPVSEAVDVMRRADR